MDEKNGKMEMRSLPSRARARARVMRILLPAFRYHWRPIISFIIIKLIAILLCIYWKSIFI